MLVDTQTFASQQVSAQDDGSLQAQIEEEGQNRIRNFVKHNAFALKTTKAQADLFVAGVSSINFIPCVDERCLNATENFVGALSDLLHEGDSAEENIYAPEVSSAILQFAEGSILNSADELQLYTLWVEANSFLTLSSDKAEFRDYYKKWSEDLARKISAEIALGQLTAKAKWILLSEAVPSDEHWLPVKRSLDRRSAVVRSEEVSARIDSAERLLSEKSDVADYASGKYNNKPVLFMFCRESRLYPCLFIMKDKDGKLYRNADGSIWHQPSLALSTRRYDYNRINGQTPQGVYRIDGVMPSANKKKSFGNYRRLVLNFISRSTSEEELKKLLPKSLHEEDWWRESVVARDIGRNALRIHGTGYWSRKGTTYYPFVSTSGCVSQREKTYDGVEYKDQRLLMDEIMKAQGLTVKYENEISIRALLYVYELDDQKLAVSIDDLTAVTDELDF